MKFEVAIIIAIAWFIIRTISKARKKRAALQERGAQVSNNSATETQNFAETRNMEARGTEMAEERETHFLDRAVEEVTVRITDPFLEPKTLETNTGHYDETALAAEYETTHAEGKTVAHHKHQLFDGDKDRQKAGRHNTKGSQAEAMKQQRADQQGTKATSRQTARQKAALQAKTDGRRKVVQNPIAKALAGPANLRQAMVITEVLRRYED